LETSELLKKVRKIEIKTKGLSNHIFSGEYQTVFKGRGMSFSEVREYQYGDEIKAIDWNVTARMNAPYVKIFEEERELTVMLIVDMSRSAYFGTVNQMKNELITELSAVLSFSAINNNDKVGVIFFTDKVEKFIPPNKGKSHILRIIRELIDFKPELGQTNIAEALRYFNNAIKKRSICFLMSDFLDSEDYSSALSIAGRKHDVIGVKIFDPRDSSLPDIGLIQVSDAETGQLRWLDTSSKKIRNRYSDHFNDRKAFCEGSFAKNGCDLINLSTADNYVTSLMGFFKRRGLRR